MDSEIPSDDSAGKKFSFTLDFNLGHLFIIFSLFLSAAGLYAHDESRLSVLENKVSVIDGQNLPPRVASLEATTKSIQSGFNLIHGDLLELRNELTASRRLSETKIQKVEARTQKNTQEIKDRIFP